MRRDLLAVLRCPACKGELALSDAETSAALIQTGTLVCDNCRRTYPIVDGVPDFVASEEAGGHVARSFGFEWRLHHEGGFESGTVFGLTLEQDVESFYKGLRISPEDLEGKIVLDAGCGSGTLTTAIAQRNPTSRVIALDVNPALWELSRKTHNVENLDIVRASIFELPFADESLNVIWCNGVLHHTGDTRRAFRGLVRKTTPGGRTYVWLYERKLSPLVGLRHLLRPFRGTSWNHLAIYRFCQLVSAPTWAAVRTLNLVHSAPAVQKRTHLRVLTRKRGYRELVLTWFDVLSPRYRDTYRTEELRAWFTEEGFEDLTDYWWPVGVSGTRKPVRAT